MQKNKHKILNADALLALYRIDPRAQFPETVFTRDQFKDVRSLNIKQSELLAVPSTKLPD